MGHSLCSLLYMGSGYFVPLFDNQNLPNSFEPRSEKRIYLLNFRATHFYVPPFFPPLPSPVNQLRADLRS